MQPKPSHRLYSRVYLALVWDSTKVSAHPRLVLVGLDLSAHQLWSLQSLAADCSVERCPEVAADGCACQLGWRL
jgi:hypothetical protein